MRGWRLFFGSMLEAIFFDLGAILGGFGRPKWRSKSIFDKFFGSVLLIFLIDRISYIYVIYLDKKILGSEIFCSKYLNINLIWYDGIAFGLFDIN